MSESDEIRDYPLGGGETPVAAELDPRVNVTALNGARVKILTRLAKTHRLSGNFDEAETLLLSGLAEFPDHPRILHSLGEVALAYYDFPKAESYFRRMLVLDPSSEFAEMGLYKIDAIQRDPSLIRAYISFVLDKVNELEASHELDEAEALLLSTLKKAPDNPRLFRALGRIALSRNDYEIATQWLERALTLDPTDKSALHSMGQGARQCGDFETAIHHFEEIIKHHPRDEFAHYSLGQVLFEQGQFEEAEASFSQVVTLNPNDKVARYMQLKARGFSGKIKEAVSEILTILDTAYDERYVFLLAFFADNSNPAWSELWSELNPSGREIVRKIWRQREPTL